MGLSRLLLASLCAVFLSGCDTQLKDYVQGAERAPSLPPPGPPQVTGPIGVKFSGGQVRAASNSGTDDVGMQATLSPTRQKLLGGSVGMTVGTSRSRTSQ